MRIPTVEFTRSMKMVSETNYTSCSDLQYADRIGMSYVLESEKIYFNGGHIYFILAKVIDESRAELYGGIKISAYFDYTFNIPSLN